MFLEGGESTTMIFEHHTFSPDMSKGLPIELWDPHMPINKRKSAVLSPLGQLLKTEIDNQYRDPDLSNRQTKLATKSSVETFLRPLQGSLSSMQVLNDERGGAREQTENQHQSAEISSTFSAGRSFGIGNPVNVLLPISIGGSPLSVQEEPPSPPTVAPVEQRQIAHMTFQIYVQTGVALTLVLMWLLGAFRRPHLE